VRLWIVLAAIAAVVFGTPRLAAYYYARWANPRVEQELRERPNGERAQKVMLITLPSGRRLPVNYLEEDGRIYAGADGRWWTELRGKHHEVKLFVRGQHLTGRARAVLDDRDYRLDVFSRLRPNAIPGFGTLVEILLDPDDPGGMIVRSREDD
jgi:hypothetical protein